MYAQLRGELFICLFTAPYAVVSLSMKKPSGNNILVSRTVLFENKRKIERVQFSKF